MRESAYHAASQALDRVIKEAIATMESSRDQIYEIAEQAREEAEQLRLELETVRRDVEVHIRENDRLEKTYIALRRRLMEVSRNFTSFSEKDIREAYDEAHRAQMALTVSQEKERELRRRRDELEFRLKNLTRTIDKADKLLTQVSVVLGYLQGDIARMTEALASAESGQLFGMKIIEAQEEERRRVAREMHDGPAQSMAHAIIRADLAQKALDQGKLEDVREELKVLKEVVRESLADVRKIIYDLRPMALDDLGLVPTVQKFIETYNEKYEFMTHFAVMGKEERLPSMIEVALFRMIQESMNNIAKHAEATLAHVVLEFLPLKVRLKIKDNSRGFDPQTVKQSGSFGLLGIRERVKLLKGTIEIQSAPGEGTMILIEVPHQGAYTIIEGSTDPWL